MRPSREGAAPRLARFWLTLGVAERWLRLWLNTELQAQTACTRPISKVDPVSFNTVSVVIPNHNYGRFLAEAVESALGQTPPPLQVIVVDDASTDDSVAVLERFGDRIERVLLAHNRGQIQAYNAGFERVRGDIVVFLDSDDRLKPGALAHITQAFRPGVAKVHWKVDMVDVGGQPLGQQVPHLLVEGDMKAQLLEQGILYPSPPGSANAYSVALLRPVMPLPQHATERHGADFFTIYGSALLGSIAVAGHGQALSDYRLHHVAPAALNFGNAAQRYSEQAQLALRNDMMREWVSHWPHKGLQFRQYLNDFSLEKNTYVHAIFGAPTYAQGLRAGLQRWPELWRCIRHRPGGLGPKVALLGVCLSILLMPRPLGLPVARYLCNPTARSQ